MFANRFTKAASILGAGLALLAPGLARGATFTVSKDGRGAFTTIQAAVDKAGKGDIVEVLDQAAYPEEVTIDSARNGLTLRSANPTALNKPTITFKDQIHQNPKTCQDALSAGKIDFDQNGALRIIGARNVTIDGIGVDAVGTAPFSWPNVWGDGVSCNGRLFPLFHANAGIVVYLSGSVTVRNCDIANAFFGISVKDRNQGGVFANFNPADLEKFNIVPLSGFGRTGNHLFEKNRIHHNTWAFFFESAWDLGSTVRYNLLYENHHATAAAAAAVKALPDGEHQPGGGFLFKDVMLTPLAIYNNTFWHNFTDFAGGYRPGAQHLIFNNIFAAPNEYYSQSKDFPNPFHILDPFFTYRMHNCLYAAQTEPPKLDSQKVQAQKYDDGTKQQVMKDTTVKFYRSVRIMNNMGTVAQENFTVDIVLPMSTGPLPMPQSIQGANLPGGLIGGGTDPFPAGSEVRWYEIRFKSTDPASPDFLSPDWDDPVVRKYVMNAGWPEAGIFNSDGKPADLGAVPSVARHAADVVIRPLAPAILNGNSATLSFDLQSLNGSISGAKVKYIRLVKSIPVLLNGFGGTKDLVVPEPATVTVANSSLKMGANSLTVSGFPALAPAESFAFFEVIAGGLGPNGYPITTNVGFIPYRKLDYKFVVEVLDAAGAKAAAVKVGETVRLCVTPQKLDGTPFLNPIAPVEVNLNSGADLFAPGTPPAKFALPQVEGATTKPILFAKVPAGGIEYVTVSGIWKNGTNTLAFYGVSDGVKILPGDPEKVVFQDPPSKLLNPGSAPVIDPGTLYPVKVEVRDRFDNPVGPGVAVAIKSNQPAIGDIEGAASAATDSLGLARFQAKVVNGDLNQLFELEAAIPGKPADKADLKVGKARDKLWILYGDTQKYDAKAELRGAAGERLKVVIRAGQDPDTKLAGRQTEFKLSGTPGLAVYASPTDTAQTYVFTLKDGEAAVYVTGLRAVEDGVLTADPTSDNTLLAGSRGKIFFSFTPGAILSAACFADNGVAAVDRLELVFRADLKRAPDSIALAWPAAGANAKRISTGIAWDAATPRKVTVKLADPFPAGLSAGVGVGTAYTFDPATPQIPAQAMAFTAKDSVGPLLDTAAVLEKPGAGDDTLFLGFTEAIDGARLAGPSLLLLKPGAAPIVLTVLAAADIPGKGWRIAVADLGPQAPAPGDSLKINAEGPLTDATGNHAHALNRPVPLRLKFKPKPPVLTVRMDKPYLGIRNDAQGPDFLVLTGNPDSSWTPVLAGSAGGTAQACRAGGCGDAVRGGPDGSIDRPAFTVETDRGIRYSVAIFNTLGEYLNGFSGEITNASLGLGERNLPVTGAPSAFARGPQGRYALKISWNAKSSHGDRAATGAYIARITAASRAEDADGRPVAMTVSRSVRFGLLRN
jgi:hypothetical protein